MTSHERNEKIRKALHAAHTCGVEASDMGVKAPAGTCWCVRCGQLLTKRRGLSHRQFRCWSFRAATTGVDGTVVSITSDDPQGCQRIIVKRPIVRAPRPPKAPDTFKKLRDKRAAAEAMLTQWDRKLALALTKVKQYRAQVYRTTRTLEAAMSGAAPLPPSKTRRIEVE